MDDSSSLGDEGFSRLIDHPDCDLEVRGLPFMVYEGVFLPDLSLTYSSSMILDHLPEVAGRTVLDIGCGSGVLAVHAARKGAYVTACDIDSRCIENTRYNAMRNAVSLELICSDLFNDISQCFDYVFANLPISDDLWGSENKPVVERFLDDLPKYLASRGEGYLTWLDVEPVDSIREAISARRYECEEFIEHKIGHDWYLFKLRSYAPRS